MKPNPTLHPPVTSPCRKRRLAESELVAVDRCECGTIQLHFGAMTLRVTPSALSEILGTLGQAVAECAGNPRGLPEFAPLRAFAPKPGQA